MAAVAVEGDQRPEARAVAAEAFAKWEELMARSLQREGLSAKRARALSTLIIASAEGAVILARAQRSMDPLDRVAGELKALVRDALRDRG